MVDTSTEAVERLLDDPWVQIGFLKERLRQAEQECIVWKDRAMTLRAAKRPEQPVTLHDAVKVPEVQALIERVEHLFDVYKEAGRTLGKSERKLQEAMRAITEGRE